MNKLFNFGEINSSERALMKLLKTDFNKIRSKITKKSRKDSKSTKCLYCGEETSRFCNSHSMPASFLRNIAVDGKVYTTNKLIDLPLFDTDEGVNKSGTFQVICRSCDSKIFQEYEDFTNYDTKPTAKMVAQIAMKNHLRNIGKRRHELAFHKNIKEMVPSSSDYIDEMLEVNNLDLNEYIRGFKRAKKTIEKGWQREFYLFYFEKLNYVVPVAFQGEIALHFDLSGNRINNVYNKSKKYTIQTIHISIFPLKSSSIIMLFMDKNNKRCRKFYQQFNKLDAEKKLEAINFIIFSYSEDVFMSKNVREIFFKDQNLQQIAGLTPMQLCDSPNEDNQVIKKSFDVVSKMGMIPNFLLLDIGNKEESISSSE